MKKKALFIDRDGTIIQEPADEQIDAFEKLVFVPGTFRALSTIRELTDYEFVMVSNQDGLGTDSFPEDTFWPVHNFILDTLKGELQSGVDASSLLGVKSSLSDRIGSLKSSLAVQNETVGGSFGAVSAAGSADKSVTVTYNQTINSPKAVDGMTIYRQTNSLLFASKVGLNNV